MSGYSWISGISIFCYLFLLLSLISSRKTERVIKSFEILLVIMLLWTGGSAGMRLQIWPGVNFWHHVSLLGMLLLCYGYYQFIQDFLNEKSGYMRYFIMVAFVAVFAFNVFTGFFIPLPEVVVENGATQFVYRYNLNILLLLIPVAFALWQIFMTIRRFCRGNSIALHQLRPLIYGVAVILAGNLLAILPFFAGLPVDMLSGAVNTVFLFYALYKKKLFRMTILLSKSNCMIIAMILGFVIFSDLALVMQRYLMTGLGLAYGTSLIIIAVLLGAMITGLYVVINSSLNAIFTRTDKRRKDLLARFSEEITHMLSVSEILQLLAGTIQEELDMSRLFVLIKDLDGQFRIEHTNNPLDEKNFYFRDDHPLIRYFKTNKKYVLLQDFCRTTHYRSMWETEKALLTNQQIECAIPLNSADGLVGCILLAGKPGKTLCTEPNIEFMQSVADICSSAVGNAYTYERAIIEAQKDDLTGLVNYKFFFEILDREFEKYKDVALSLCLINVDDFKRYNQLYGNKEGDLALQRIASIIASSISEVSYAARTNGDEFAIILPGYDIYSAKCLADNIAEQIGNIRVSDTAGKLSVSIGICAAPYMASSARELYRNADSTVYAVKRTGKNAVQMYSADINRRDHAEPAYKSGYTENASTIYALTAAVDAKDHYTFHHSQNVAYYASELAKAAEMKPDVVEIVKEAGLLHDIGKISIREDILNKPEKLTPDEFEIMKSHVESAVNIIRHLPSLEYLIPAVLSHHERYDGKGYPRKLAEDNIPITGRILCIADSFDAITSTRNYKPALSLQEAITIMRSEAGKQFDPVLVDVFIDHLENGKIELRTGQTDNAEQPAEQPEQAEQAERT